MLFFLRRVCTLLSKSAKISMEFMPVHAGPCWLVLIDQKGVQRKKLLLAGKVWINFDKMWNTNPASSIWSHYSSWKRKNNDTL